MPNQIDVPGEVFNNAFAEKIEAGLTKEAAVNVSSFIREKAREDSIVANKILTEQPIDVSDLDRDLDDTMRIIVEKEPDSKAMYIDFDGLPPSTIMQTERVEVPLGMIVTEEIVKNTYHLKTLKTDMRKVITDNQTKDILYQQDGKFFRQANALATIEGAIEYFPGGFTKNNYAEALKLLDKNEIPLGCVAMNSCTARDILKWPAEDIGDMHVANHFTKGVTVTELAGYKLIVSIKRNIIPDNVVWFFGQEDYLGKFYTLDDCKVYMEQKGWIVKWFAYKVLGMSILNSKAIYKAIFENPPTT